MNTEGRPGTARSGRAAAQLLLPYISYLICGAGGFLGPVHSVILSRADGTLVWIGSVEEEEDEEEESSPGADQAAARVSGFGWPAAAWRQTVETKAWK